jgi:hypothetical protein
LEGNPHFKGPKLQLGGLCTWHVEGLLICSAEEAKEICLIGNTGTFFSLGSSDDDGKY